MSSLKEILNAVLLESGFLTPASYTSSTNPDDAQLVALANAASDDIREIGLSGTRRFASITLDGTGDYALPADFHAYVPDTAWVGTRKVDLPLTPQDWACLKATGVSLYEYRARLINTLRTLGDANGDTLTFEYVSSYPWTDGASVAKAAATDDTDVWTLDGRLIKLATKWRWKKEKGIEDWTADQQLYQRHANYLRGRDGGAKALIFGDPMWSPSAPYTNLWIT